MALKRTQKKAKNTKKTKKSNKKVKSAPRVRRAKLIKAMGKIKKDTKRKEARKEVNVTAPDEAKKLINMIMTNEKIVEYLKKNVSKRAIDVISLLSYPRTDEYIAEQLGLKVNAVRRILNILQGYGVTNYHISKNDNGWLSFGWYINANKMPTFLEYIDNLTKTKDVADENCNDYFICKKCFENEKFVYTFDAAFEAGFKCKTCNGKLEHIGKEEVEQLLKKGENEKKAVQVASQELGSA
ncbi:MAG: hypothetical protein ACP5K5_00565 [Candidatus Micrarchaeia archaeon]